MKKEKNVKKVKDVSINDEVILGNNEKKLVKFASLLMTFFATCLVILIFIFSIISISSVANLGNDALANNNIVVTLVSKLNGYSLIETKELIMNMTNNFSFIMLEIVIPCIAFIGAMLLLIVLSKRFIDFTSDINTEKDLYTLKKSQDLQDMIAILSVILLTTLVIFNEPSIIFYCLIELLLCIIYYLFKKNVLLKNK